MPEVKNKVPFISHIVLLNIHVSVTRIEIANGMFKVTKAMSAIARFTTKILVRVLRAGTFRVRTHTKTLPVVETTIKTDSRHASR